MSDILAEVESVPQRAAPRERPILFQSAMVRAILAGTKTQTRRAVKGTARDWLAPGMFSPEYVADPSNGLCPYGFPGDRLWVRESLKPWTHDPELFAYAADDTRVQGDGMNYPVKPGRPYVPSIHLARCWSRLLLEVTEVRVERLQSISDADALAEGIEAMRCPDCHLAAYGLPGWGHDELNPTATGAYRFLWESINGAGSWDASPWVWAVSFRRVTT